MVVAEWLDKMIAASANILDFIKNDLVMIDDLKKKTEIYSSNEEGDVLLLLMTATCKMTRIMCWLTNKKFRVETDLIDILYKSSNQLMLIYQMVHFYALCHF